MKSFQEQFRGTSPQDVGEVHAKNRRDKGSSRKPKTNVQQKTRALGGHTPLEVVRDPDSKEMVEASFSIGSEAIR